MKNLKFLLILSLAITLFSCKSNDDTPSSANADLLGTWKVTAITGAATGNAVDSNTMTTVPIAGVLTGKNLTASAVITESPNNFTGSGTYDFDLVLTPTAGGTPYTYSQALIKLIENNPAIWTRVGTILTIVDGTDISTYTLNINGDTLTAVTSDSFSDVDGTVTRTGTLNSSFTLTRQ